MFDNRTRWCACHTFVMVTDHDTRTHHGMTHTVGLCLVSSLCTDRRYGYRCAREVGHPQPHTAIDHDVRWWDR